jgi:hypothetical protein
MRKTKRDDQCDANDVESSEGCTAGCVRVRGKLSAVS